MTSSEAIRLKIMTIHGWNVQRRFPIDGSSYFEAEKEGFRIIDFGIKELFELWLEHDEVLKQFTGTVTKRN